MHYLTHKNYYRFNGTFKVEPLTQFPHGQTGALGFYRDSPFITGDFSDFTGDFEQGYKTEIMDYKAQRWNSAAGYPYSSGPR